MKLFVTGGGGFLGLAMVRQLHAKGHEIISFSRSAYPELEALGVQHIQGNLSDPEAVKNAMEGCEAVFHVAAKAGIWGTYEEYFEANVTGTRNVINACKEWGIRYLVYTSSPSVIYSGEDSEGKNESLPYPEKYYAFYPQTKAIAEKEIMAANSGTLKTVSLRPHLIWGPGDVHFIPRLFDKARAGRLRLVGKRDCLVDTIYVENAAEAHVLAFEQMLKDPSPVEGKTYFISQDQPITSAEFMNRLIATGGFPPVTKSISAGVARFAGGLLEFVYRLFGVKSEPAVTRFMARQLSTSHWYDISASKKDFGYSPRISIDEGMELLEKWVQENRESLP